MKSSWLRSKWVVGSVLLIQLGSGAAFAQDSAQSPGILASLRGFFSSWFQSRSPLPAEQVQSVAQGEVEENVQPSATPEPVSEAKGNSQLPLQTQELGAAMEVQALPNLDLAVPAAEPAPRTSVVFARRAGYPPAIFKPHERFDQNDPESFARLEDALAEDAQVNSLITYVLNETGKSSLRELVTFKVPRNPFQHGISMISTDRATPDSVLPGWPALDTDGMLMVDRNPGERLQVTVELNPKSEMIELYSTIIHELTHVHGSLERMKSENINELLTFKDAKAYSVWNIERLGGELDAFAAEISAVIRYRNRYNLPYEAFYTPRNERYFSDKSGELINRSGLEESIAGKGNALAYYATGLDKFAQMIQLELRYNETLLQQLKSSASYDARADVREEARRLETRIQRIHSQYGY